jgi:hypothetical protein
MCVRVLGAGRGAGRGGAEGGGAVCAEGRGGGRSFDAVNVAAVAKAKRGRDYSPCRRCPCCGWGLAGRSRNGGGGEVFDAAKWQRWQRRSWLVLPPELCVWRKGKGGGEEGSTGGGG